jgi:hypothetical protein
VVRILILTPGLATAPAVLSQAVGPRLAFSQLEGPQRAQRKTWNPHPWKRAAPEPPYSKEKDPGIDFEYWPDPVKEAFNELTGGGRDRQAAGNSELKRVTNALTSDAYYRPASWDRRGRELVSHLIELAYRSNFSQPFENVFPLVRGVAPRRDGEVSARADGLMSQCRFAGVQNATCSVWGAEASSLLMVVPTLGGMPNSPGEM